MFTYFIIVLYALNCVFVASEPECFDGGKENVHRHLGTKTPYRIVSNRDDSPLDYKDCEPQRIWAVIRHGSRNPNRKIIRLFQTRFTEIRDQILNAQKEHRTLCDVDLDRFRNWKSRVHEDEYMHLVKEGTDELLELAERMQVRFPDLLPDIYNNATYRFKFTESQRTQKSFEAFATGLFGNNNINEIWYPSPMKKDPILRFYKACAKWKFEVDDNPATLDEQAKWADTTIIRNAVRSVNQRAGLRNKDKLLSIQDVHHIYTVCAFETAWNKREESPWCSLWDGESIKAMEFYEDLEYFYIDGYGSELTYKQACPAIIDMVTRIEPTSVEPKVTFYFTHSGTILKLLAHLGLYKDDFRLTHKDFGMTRKWQVSKIDTFASNLAFVLYNCQNIPHLLFLHQERPVRLPQCPQHSDLCSLADFKTIYRESLEDCNFDEMCSLNKEVNEDNNRATVDNFIKDEF